MWLLTTIVFINKFWQQSRSSFSTDNFRSFGILSWVYIYYKYILKIKLDKDTKEKKYRLIKETDLQPYTFKNEKEVFCLNEKNCQSNSSNSDEDLSIEY